MKPLLATETISHSSAHIPHISIKTLIEDSRILKDFKDQVFGGYKLSQASQALDKALSEDKMEPALHWSAQLLLSGYVNSLWSKLLSFASKNINIYNPQLPEFILNRNTTWYSIVDNVKYSKDNILQLRNHPTIRLLLAEMVSALILSKKRKLNQLPRIKKEEFLIDNFKSKLESKDNNIVEGIFQDGDPSEIKIATGEMAYQIFNNNINKTLFWFNWIMEWEKINSKKYGKYECASRPLTGVDTKFQKDVIWLIWSVIHKLRGIKFSITGKGLNKQIESLWELYCNKFTSGSRIRKQPLIIWSFLYLTESTTIDNNITLIDRPQLLFQSLLGFDKLIMTLKTQEVHKINPIRNELLNVVVENNYMVPANYKELEQQKQQQPKNSIIKNTNVNNTNTYNTNNNSTSNNTNTISGKQSKTNTESMKKLNDIYKLDRMMYS